ncbi:SDR family NAD(P)-dependent oxidoreductase [Acuticoccus kandeliae]|uniref:SDR family NAD(P)-dependent oxidoreductase n=1 Tax=Acuticoccus kandeliae TaxID=2073160 RepID=UPI001300BA38|nr:3-oxoacyl-ACP reductase family protein [Acuticoccus kandeliae]
MRLQDKIALVTGAAGGIGNAIAQAFAAEGAHLVVGDIKNLPALKDSLSAHAGSVTVVELDVADPASVRHFVDTAEKVHGRVDIIANCAGIARYGAAETLTEAVWDEVLDINLKGTFLCCQAVIPLMRRQQSGRIINIGSVIGKNGGNARAWLDRDELNKSGNIAYGVSKAGVHIITSFLARELAAEGITVNAIAPGPIASEMTKSFPDSLKLLVPVGRMGRAEEVAEAAVYLASDLAGFVTAEILDVNGGMWAD